MSDFSERLKNLRERNGWSKTYVADKLQLKNMQTYANYEYGKREPDLEILSKIANLYDVSTDYLLGNNSKDSSENYDNDLKTFLDKNLHHGMFYGGGPSTKEQEQQLEGALKAIYYEYYANEAEMKEGDN